MQGYTMVGAAGNAGSTSVTFTGGQNATPKDPTALEAHLSFLRNLYENTQGALNRLMGCADRLLGSEPQPPKGNGIEKVSGAALNQPILQQVDEISRGVAQLLEAVHTQLNRLDRV